MSNKVLSVFIVLVLIAMLMAGYGIGTMSRPKENVTAQKETKLPEEQEPVQEFDPSRVDCWEYLRRAENNSFAETKQTFAILAIACNEIRKTDLTIKKEKSQ